MAATKTSRSLADRVKDVGSSQAVDLMSPPPPPETEEVIPSINEVVQDRKTRLELARTMSRVGEITQMVGTLNKEKKPLVAKLKVYAGELEISKVVYEDWRMSYYGTPRKKLSATLLTSVLLKMKLMKQDGTPLDKKDVKKILAKSTEEKTSYCLKVLHSSATIGEEEEENA